MITASQFYKWLKVFKVLTGSNRPVTTSYGEMFVSNNGKFTAVPYPTLTAVKIEAGAMGLTPSYAAYQSNTAELFTFANGRLTFTGATPGMFLITTALTAYMAAPGVSSLIYFTHAKNGTPIDKSTVSSYVTLAAEGSEKAIAIQCVSYLETGDYIEVFLQNNTSASGPTVRYLNTSAEIITAVAAGEGPLVNSDDVVQGDEHWFATLDGGDTDELATLPTIVDMESAIGVLADDIAALQTEVTGKMAKASNLSDVANRSEAQRNIGFTAEPITVTASIVLGNPMNSLIQSEMALPDQSITLPAMDDVDSMAYSQLPLIYCQPGTEAVIIRYIDNSVLATIQPGQAIQLVLIDNASENGVFQTRGTVFTVNELTGYVVLTGADIETVYEATGYTPTSDTLDGQFEGISNRFNTFANNSNGVTIATQSGSTGATVINSQASRNGNIATLTGRVRFTATNTTPLIIIAPPFGASFTDVNQASGVASITKTTGAAIGDGTVPIIDSVSGQGIEFSSIVAVGSGSYDLYFSVQYTIAN
jgi:hypothetical protein